MGGWGRYLCFIFDGLGNVFHCHGIVDNVFDVDTAVPLIFFWLTSRTQLVLHPDNPIRTSDSLAIQATFVGLFVLVGLAAALLVWRGVKNESQ